MTHKSKNRFSRKKQRVRLLWFIGLIMIAFYLWGTVQIDFDLRENDSLEQKKQNLQDEVNDLRIQVNRLASYQRIVPIASEMGLVFLSANHKRELLIDWKNMDSDLDTEEYRLQYAAFF